MGKAYYAGVPGMHEQFGPVVASAVKNSINSGRKYQQSNTLGSFITLFILTLPLMSFWAGLMMLKEGFQVLKTFPDSPERKQAVFNVKFAAVFFVIGLFMFDITIGRFI